MSNFIDDIMGTPRRRSKAPGRSLLGTPSPLRREESSDVFHSALSVPTQASLAKTAEAGISSAMESPRSVGSNAPSVDGNPPLDEAGSLGSVAGDMASPQEEVPPSVEGERDKEEDARREEARKAEETRARREARRREKARRLEEGQSQADTAESSLMEAPPWQDRSISEPERQQTPALDVLPPIPVAHSQPAVMIGISGCTGSGKTMLSHLLSWVLPSSTPCFVLHQDDFFIPRHFLIPSKDGAIDADCRHAINFGALIRVMEYIKHEAKMPPGFHTEQNEEYEREQAGALITQDVLDEAREVFEKSGLLSDGRPICIVDGFLLYHEPRIRELLDIKFFLRVKKDTARDRRFGKPEYAGEQPEEEFWKTDAYFDRISWPNYVEEHSPLFERADVEGTLIEKLCKHLDIDVQPDLETNAEETLRWAANRIANAVRTANVEQSRQISRDLEPEAVLGDRFQPCDCGSGCLGKFRRFLFEHV